MNFRLLFRTVRHLRWRQLYGQVKIRLIGRKYVPLRSPGGIPRPVMLPCTDKYVSLEADGRFTFLNVTSAFVSWNDTSNGMLWAYNLNYMDWLLQPQAGFEVCAGWIDHFAAAAESNVVGLSAYPTSLRGINWIKFIARHFDEIDGERLCRWNDSLYSQYVLLSRNMEYHLLGNHLLENAFSLFVAALYFRDERLWRIGSGVLCEELAEQILSDGAHFEQSPMYHCILLDRLLDCCNISFSNAVFPQQAEVNGLLAGYARRMLGYLSRITCCDGTIPLLNDSARGIAPAPECIFDYASRLGLHPDPVRLGVSGYRKLCDEWLEAIVDIGNTTASYQPGHSHADTFSFELRLGGRPFIVDTGISTYEKNSRRQYERSTAAHNTVSVNGLDSGEVWGGFRLGRRAEVTVLEDEPLNVKAYHDGFGKRHKHVREFSLRDGVFEVTDEIAEGDSGVGYLHFAPGTEVNIESDVIVAAQARIRVAGAERMELCSQRVSVEYNRYEDIMTVKIYFRRMSKYTVIPVRAESHLRNGSGIGDI